MQRANTHFSETILDVFAGACDLEASSLSLQTSLQDLGLDSLGMVTVLSQVQFICNVSLDEDQVLDVLNSKTLADIVTVFAGLAGTQRAPIVRDIAGNALSDR